VTPVAVLVVVDVSALAVGDAAVVVVVVVLEASSAVVVLSAVVIEPSSVVADVEVVPAVVAVAVELVVPMPDPAASPLKPAVAATLAIAVPSVSRRSRVTARERSMVVVRIADFISALSLADPFESVTGFALTGLGLREAPPPPMDQSAAASQPAWLTAARNADAGSTPASRPTA
jgi:hypothetical protein